MENNSLTKEEQELIEQYRRYLAIAFGIFTSLQIVEEDLGDAHLTTEKVRELYNEQQKRIDEVYSKFSEEMKSKIVAGALNTKGI